MSMLSDDLAAIFADTSLFVPVLYGTSPEQSTRGSLSTEDMPETDGSGGVVLIARRIVTVMETSLTGVRRDQPVTVDGTAYVIHDVRSGGRGKLKIVIA